MAVVSECGGVSIGEFGLRVSAEREAVSLAADAPDGVEIVLHVRDSGRWVVCEHELERCMSCSSPIVAGVNVRVDSTVCEACS